MNLGYNYKDSGHACVLDIRWDLLHSVLVLNVNGALVLNAQFLLIGAGLF